jgi:hypothetical protein
MPLATERVVVQITSTDKRKIEAKAKKMHLPLAEMMRRAAFSYSSEAEEAELGALTERAKQSADNSLAAIDDALSFIAASNKRIEAMERESIVNSRKHNIHADPSRLAS